MNIVKKSVLAAAAIALLSACNCADNATKSGLVKADFETEVNGKATSLYTLTNANGVEVCITNFGGRIVSIMVPDNKGEFKDVVLGFDNIQDYINVPSDFGASIGRYANRIAQGRFAIDGVEYDLPKNNFGHCLHGGPQGWQYQVYEVENVTENQIVLRMDSPAGDQQFPGAVTAWTTYTLTDDNAVEISYKAVTDAPTIINMTNHSYFNLGGDPTATVCEDVLWVNSTHFTPVDDTYMTTGEIVEVAGTPMDFYTEPKAVGRDINCTDYVQIANGNGYDHNWVLATAGNMEEKAVELYSPASGIKLTVYTDEPGIQVYSGNFLDGTVTGKKDIVYNQRTGICLETQHYPDSPNKAEWPSVVLRPGETYTSNCTFAFSTVE